MTPELTLEQRLQLRELELQISNIVIRQLQANSRLQKATWETRTAQQDLNRINEELEKKHNELQAAVDVISKELNLGSTWDFDVEELRFIQRPV